MYFNMFYFQYVCKCTCQYKKQKEKEMRNSPAYELNIWNFVHLYIQRKGEEDPYRRADNHGKKQKNEFQAVSCPAQPSPPQFIEIWLDLVTIEMIWAAS